MPHIQLLVLVHYIFRSQLRKKYQSATQGCSPTKCLVHNKVSQPPSTAYPAAATTSSPACNSFSTMSSVSNTVKSPPGRAPLFRSTPAPSKLQTSFPSSFVDTPFSHVSSSSTNARQSSSFNRAPPPPCGDSFFEGASFSHVSPPRQQLAVNTTPAAAAAAGPKSTSTRGPGLLSFTPFAQPSTSSMPPIEIGDFDDEMLEENIAQNVNTYQSSFTSRPAPQNNSLIRKFALILLSNPKCEID